MSKNEILTTSTKLTYNSGLDVYFNQISKSHLLARTRLLRNKYNFLGNHGFNLKDTTVDKKDRSWLLKIASKSDLIKVYGSNWVQFANEEKLLKSILKKDENNISVSQKIFLYAVSKNYRIENADYCPVKLQEWKNHSWTVTSLLVTKNTSQRKLGTFLGKTREYVNKKLKHNAHNLYVGNNFIKVSDSLLGKEKDLKWLKTRLNQGSFGAYRLHYDGTLVRQIPNTYKLKDKFKGAIKFSKNTFYYSNKALNKVYFSELENQNSGTNKRVPSIKHISLLRSANRGKAHAKIFGIKECSSINANKASERYFKEFDYSFKSKNKKKTIRTTKIGMVAVNSKMAGEFRLLKKLDIPLISEFNSLGFRTNLTLNKAVFPYQGRSFKQATCRRFHKDLKITSNFKNQFNVRVMSQYWDLKIRQRQYFGFIGKSFSHNLAA